MASRSKKPEAVSGRSELASAIYDCRRALVGIVIFSGIMNILTLTGPLFMLQVYDRVVPSQSIPTLLALGAIVALLYAALGFFDQIRARILVRIGAYLDEVVHPKVFKAVVTMPLRNALPGDGLQPLRDLDQIRTFVSSGGPAAFADMPFLPIQVTICFLIDPLIGYAVIVGAVVIFCLTLATDMSVRAASLEAADKGGQRFAVIEAGRRNAEVLRSLGMAGRLADRWGEVNRSYEASHLRVLERSGAFAGASKVFRMMFQSGLLGLGAYLVIEHGASFGIIIAASILGARALQPIEQLVANWRGFVGSRQAWHRLNRLLAQFPTTEEPMALPRPTGTLAVENLAVVPPGSSRPSVVDVSFNLRAGNALGVIGPSGAGKSSLVRVIIGAWAPARGRVRLDGAALEQWHPDILGQHIGYLPQDVELFAGTIAENISRFEPDADPALIVEAAKAAGVHDLVLHLPDGYTTDIGENGSSLSAGQRQRVALARALYRDPFLVVLDEPNSNLDAEGDAALSRAIMSVRKRGGIAVVVAHRPSALEAVDMALAMVNGGMAAFGEKEEVLRKVLKPSAPPSIQDRQPEPEGAPS
ncbi:type I secretion system permease/ATPase [Bauldia litoralis]|uniref:ATP-binding cassette, subfamily C n=1 Tax=Bauldia litoralis TaxID=665467 RepID=A0A1G6E159_9HYPH|nr:type I secretion system permease/ATPase [Bauldia litoralis]SDB51080.1 ATP-binding cassette, subfamily C [Bauldia litoralis]